MREVLIKQNRQWRKEMFEEGVQREVFAEFVKEIEKGFIKAIVGPRRAGKSFFLKQILNYLINKGIKPENILYVNFEEPVFIKEKKDPASLQRLFEEYLTLHNPEGKIYLFLDEVQNIDQWQYWVRTQYDENKKLNITITGSNSELLSSELATHLSGRVITYDIFPFSFKEYLTLNKVNYENKQYSELLNDKHRIINLLEKFLKKGSFPEVAKEEDIEFKDKILKGYFESMLYKDIIPRFNIRNSRKIEQLAFYLITNFTNLYSYNQLAKIVDSNENTVKEYISYFEKAFLLFECELFSYSIRKQTINNRKIFCIDNGLRNTISFKFSEDIGKLAENAVFIALKKKYKKIYYWQNRKEVDFVVKDDNIIGLNVTYSDIIDKREIDGLKEFGKGFKKEHPKLMIITKDKYCEEENIKYIPLWLWLIT